MSNRIETILAKLRGQLRPRIGVRIPNEIIDLARVGANRMNQRRWAPWLELAILEKAERDGLLSNIPLKDRQ